MSKTSIDLLGQGPKIKPTKDLKTALARFFSKKKKRKRVAESVLINTWRRLLKAFEGPYVDFVAKAIASGDILSVLKAPPDPACYTDPRVYAADRQCWALMAKYPFRKIVTPEQRKNAAIMKVIEAEEQCKLTNKRFRSDKHTDRTHAIIQIAQRKIQRWLGPLPLAQILRLGRFGPGLTLGLEDSSQVAMYYKIQQDRVSVSPSLEPFLRSFFSEVPGWARAACMRPCTDDYGNLFYIPSFEVHSSNSVTTVPKTALTDRPIAIEPTLNQFLQLGTGEVLKARLKRLGIDLRHGQAEHRELARQGSIRPDLIATLDLASASDTVSKEVVATLLAGCPDWLHWLNLCRSTHGELPDGQIICYEKFSSMGNGYTFELETLIFLSLVHATYDFLQVPIPEYVKVYGDDIIVSTQVADDVITTLESFGFSTNRSKSFYDPQCFFRESCGADYFSGQAVRPIYITKEITDAEEYVTLCNRLFATSSESINPALTCRDYRFAWLYLVERIPAILRNSLSSPIGVQGSLWTPEAWHYDKMVVDDSLNRLRCPTWRLHARSKTRRMDGLAAILHAAERSSVNGRVELRNTRLISLVYEYDPVQVAA